jgi:hypothetical protein
MQALAVASAGSLARRSPRRYIRSNEARRLRSGDLLVDPLQHRVHVCVYRAGDLL